MFIPALYVQLNPSRFSKVRYGKQFPMESHYKAKTSHMAIFWPSRSREILKRYCRFRSNNPPQLGKARFIAICLLHVMLSARLERRVPYEGVPHHLSPAIERPFKHRSSQTMFSLIIFANKIIICGFSHITLATCGLNK